MSGDQLQALLQVVAGLFAVWGVFFLAIGTFNTDEPTKDARRFAPILPAAV